MQKFSKFFWSCYSASLDIEHTVATPNEFFYLKKFIHINKKKQFFLSPLTATNTMATTQQSFSQTSLNSSIIRLSEYKLKNTILKLIKS